ncbi:hypothetical protein FN846DRAFT_894732 [Sphaerosporella brunnea]|uniref:Uncharacterized protein n=1 Tax=Sphaerosporella brunnea TaxID=1250544 RepID=A0A5J5EIB3_9PEZI|nr:hypothetical protein FN846DRAFT_894732 [Sphaerosporella brunnea]
MAALSDTALASFRDDDALNSRTIGYLFWSIPPVLPRQPRVPDLAAQSSRKSSSTQAMTSSRCFQSVYVSNSRYDKSNDRYEELKNRHDELRDRHDELRDRHDELKDAHIALQQQMSHLREATQEKISQLREANAALNAKLSAADEVKGSNASEINALRKTAAITELNLGMYKREVESLRLLCASKWGNASPRTLAGVGC